MKKTFLASLTILLGLQMVAWTPMLLAQEDYPENEYTQNNNGEYTYDDNYSDVAWDSFGQFQGSYCTYDSYNMVMVVIGHRVFMVPYEFFYARIWPYCSRHLRYYSYDYFANWWGIQFYNHIWDRYSWHRHGRNYRRGYNYYTEHRNRFHGSPHGGEFQIHKNSHSSANSFHYKQSVSSSRNQYSRFNQPSGHTKSFRSTARSRSPVARSFSNSRSSGFVKSRATVRKHRN